MKQHFLIRSVLFIFMSSCFFACNNQSKNDETDSAESQEQLVKQADSLLRNIEIKWTEMEYADNALIENSKILADTIATLQGLNQPLYDSIPLLIEQIKQLTYDQESITNGEKIDTFDQAVTNLVQALQRLQQSTAGIADCLVCEGIFKVIQEIDNEYVIRRKKYDIEVDKFNKFVQTNQKILAELDGKKYKPLPLFSIVE